MLRGRLVCGVSDDGIQRRLLAELDLTFEKSLKTAQAVESANRKIYEDNSRRTQGKHTKPKQWSIVSATDVVREATLSGHVAAWLVKIQTILRRGLEVHEGNLSQAVPKGWRAHLLKEERGEEPGEEGEMHTVYWLRSRVYTEQHPHREDQRKWRWTTTKPDGQRLVYKVGPTGKLTLEEVLENHSEVFKEEMGQLRGTKAHIHVDKEALPKFYKPRLVPYALKPLVEKELQQLLEDKSIEPGQFSEWAAPIGPVHRFSSSAHTVEKRH
ncbi:hypothetical protein NFI96_031952 [Prochilodus magdalenae]|nr:hypothetical protein NFI96_031952 [Prochilodus magdalenae]